MIDTPNTNHLVTGRNAERDALLFLESKGLVLLERNYSCNIGEIDLIMRDGEYVVFVEVRHRTNPSHGNALESITPSKIRKIIGTAKFYLLTKKWVYTIPCRFDIIAFHPVAGEIKLEWLKNAFTLDR